MSNHNPHIDLMLASITGTLTSDGKEELARLIEQGKIDACELETLRRRFEDLENVPADPSQESVHRMRAGFARLLKAEKSAWRPSMAAMRYLMPVAAGILIMLFGFLIGMLIGSSLNTKKELAGMQDDVEKIKNELVFQAWQQSAASERIQVVGQVGGMERVDDQMLMILIHTLNNDADPQVRRAAVQALQGIAEKAPTGAERVRSMLVQSLALQTHPLVRISLIESLVELQESSAIEEMERLLLAGDIDVQTREYLHAGIAALTM